MWRVLLDENTKPTADTLKAAADKIEVLRFHDSVELMLEARAEESGRRTRRSWCEKSELKRDDLVW